MPRDYYEVLGVGRDADRGRGEDGLPRGSPASCTPTSTPTTRRPRRSSRRRRRPTRCSPTPSGAAPTTPTATRACAAGGFRPGAGFGSVEDIFQAFFGGSGFGFEVRRGPMRGQDLIHAVEISAVDAMLGGDVKVPSHEGEREIELPAGNPARHPVRAARPRAARRRTAAPRRHRDRRPRDRPQGALRGAARARQKLGESLEPRNLRSRARRRGGLLLPRPPGFRLIRLAVRCRPEQAELVLAELTVLAPERGRGGARARLRRVRDLRRRGGAARAGRDRGGGRRAAWSRSSRPRFPTTGPTAGRTSTSRCWSASGSGCGPPGRSRGRATIDVVVDPGRAFGTGAHPTTRLCLELLLELGAAGEANGPLTDLGTGSGVLAIAAAKLGWGPVTGYDHEQPAIEAAAANAAVNGVEIDLERVNLREGLPELAPTVVANMTAPVLRDVAAQLRTRGDGEGSAEPPRCSPPSPPRLPNPRLLGPAPAELDESPPRSPPWVSPRPSAASTATGRRCCSAAGWRYVSARCPSRRSSTPATRSRSSCTSSRSCWRSARPSATRSSSRSRPESPRGDAGDPRRGPEGRPLSRHPGMVVLLLAGIYLLIDGDWDASKAFISVGFLAIVSSSAFSTPSSSRRRARRRSWPNGT